jgi:DNA-binding IclR family transcriptional regulator
VDLAGELDLPKGTVHGLLRTLQSVGLVEPDLTIDVAAAPRVMPTG